jgi:hypothetical protein
MRRLSPFPKGLLLALGLFVFSLALAERTPTSRELAEAGYREIRRSEEVLRYVSSQGTSILYLGTRELVPGLGGALKGKQVTVIVPETVKAVPWMDRAGVRYTLRTLPGNGDFSESLLVARQAYLLSYDSKRKLWVLLENKEAAEAVARILDFYLEMAEAVKRKRR